MASSVIFSGGGQSQATKLVIRLDRPDKRPEARAGPEHEKQEWPGSEHLGVTSASASPGCFFDGVASPRRDAEKALSAAASLVPKEELPVPFAEDIGVLFNGSVASSVVAFRRSAMRRSTPHLVYLGPEDRLVSDEWLARAAAAGDTRALEELYRRYETPVVRYVQRFARDNDIAVDLFQEAFFRAYVNLGSFDPRRSFRPWLYRIATNVARDWIRHESRALPPATEAGEPSVISIVEARDQARRVESAVAELSEDHRLVVILRHYQGLSYAEIAEITGSPEGTVRSRMHYALRALRAKLRFLVEEDDDE